MTWFEELSRDRREWVASTRRNDFEAGIRGSTVDKYADPAHFVYELLQNAEDQEATWVRFQLEADRLVFTHNGQPFTSRDVKAITGIGNSDKLSQANKIGRFGLGFKSVFAVSNRPEIYTTLDGTPFAFAIEDLVMPVPLCNGPVLADEETRFVLQFKEVEGDSIHRTIAAKLSSLGADVLLFLNNIATVDWQAGSVRGTYACDRSTPGHCILRDRVMTEAGEVVRESRFLLYTRNVEVTKADRPLSVRLAFRLDEQGQVVSEDKPTKLFVYFETEEQSGLRFRVHGPFLLTDNRANIKRGARENTHLIRECEALLLDALLDMRSKSLLGSAALAALPIDTDDLPEYLQSIRTAVVTAMREHALVPVHGGGHARASELAQGPQAIRELLDAASLGFLTRHNVAAWAVGVMRGSRQDQFLRTVGIKTWDWTEFVNAVEDRFGDLSDSPEGHDWLRAHPDSWMQHFYAVLFKATQELDETPSGLKECKIVRREDNSHTTGAQAYFPTEKGTVSLQLPRVKWEILSGKSQTRKENARKLLVELGVREVGEREEIQAILKKQYTVAGNGLSSTTHLRHMRRFLEWWSEKQDSSLFRDAHLFLDREQRRLRRPADCYMDSPLCNSCLRAVYSSGVPNLTKEALWEGYEALLKQGFVKFAAALGVQVCLEVTRVRLPATHPYYHDLIQDYLDYRTRWTDSAISEDYDLPFSSGLLALRDPEVSRVIWKTMMESASTVLHARFRPNQQHQIRYAPSSIIIKLRDEAWVPDREGVFRRPREMTRSQLPPGFLFREGAEWLASVRFGEAERQRSDRYRRRQEIARELGLPLELLDRLDEFDEADRQVMIEQFSGLLDKELEPEFPERQSPDPSRRAARLRVRLADSPAKTREPRTRTVRTSEPMNRQDAREYLRDLYTNVDRTMICQACQRAMPFRLDNDEYYFEAVELFTDAEHEYRENYLAMCPTCAAMFKHASAVDLEEFRETLSTTADLRVQVTLAREARQIRFVEDHHTDLLAVMEVEFHAVNDR
jgi:hypothetical protein